METLLHELTIWKFYSSKKVCVLSWFGEKKQPPLVNIQVQFAQKKKDGTGATALLLKTAHT